MHTVSAFDAEKARTIDIRRRWAAPVLSPSYSLSVELELQQRTAERLSMRISRPLCLFHVHHSVRCRQASQDDYHAETIAQATPGVKIPVMRGRIIVGFGESDRVSAAQGGVLVLNAEHACERRRKVGEGADKNVNRHVIRLHLFVERRIQS